MECVLKLFLKSALAFFFLFFLHETSIGNGQQGISYNGSAAWRGAGLLPTKPQSKYKFLNN
jgi:hypothetical protein